jgi:hypothetical protein
LPKLQGRKEDRATRRKPGSKNFIVTNVDPFRPGVISAAGVAEYETSRESGIFELVDLQLAEARRSPGYTEPTIDLLANPFDDKPKKKKGKKKKQDESVYGFDLDITL